MRTALTLIFILALGGGYYWYTSTALSTPVSQGMPVPGTNTEEMIVTPPGVMEDGTIDAPAPGALKEFVVTNEGMSFTTKTLSVKKGDRVKITYQNTGGTHDFRIDGYNVGTNVIKAGVSESFEFIADKAGSFEYFCSVGSHRANGMVGTLVVQE